MGGKAPAILLVSDDPEVRDRVRSALLGEGYDLWLEDSGRSAWKLLGRLRDLPRLILLDLAPSNADSWRLMGDIMGHPRFDGIPIVTLAARDSGGLPTAEAEPDTSAGWSRTDELVAMVTTYCRA